MTSISCARVRKQTSSNPPPPISSLLTEPVAPAERMAPEKLGRLFFPLSPWRVRLLLEELR